MKKWNNIVNESSLSRIKDAVDKHSCGAITAFRGELSKTDNRARNNELFAALKSKKYGITKVKGSYVEQFGTPDANEVGEETWFVVNLAVDGDDKGQLEKDLIALGKKYDQDSILTIRNGEAHLIGTSKRDNAFPSLGKKEKVGNGKYGKTSGEFFSRIRGRQFAFESVEEPQTINGKLGLKLVGERIWKEIVTEAKHNQKGYKFYVLNKAGTKINSGWEYKEDAQDGKEDDPSSGRIVQTKTLMTLGLDPNKNESWNTM